MKISRLDHLVLTVRDIPATVDFYSRVLGMEVVTFAQGRTALIFGQQKINLHQSGREFEPKAGCVMPGSTDLCFILEQSLAHAVEVLEKHGVPLIDGPVERTGAVGKIRSVYFRDPDQNLIEVSEYLSQSGSAPEDLRPSGEFEWP
ncbi:VOC family protein [Vibrio quintilis]|uniref:Virulence protein n=1 Tax=Vibrio quintilis TaxID=1117707 RepID=A0A1M7YQ07_9VIBR|nr:VOC family protein [Vibrio quintilis]SHO54708.1 Virulence protein [Vibrio quintilis]